MTHRIPNKTTVIITARRLTNIVQEPATIVIGLPAQITYDVESIEPHVVVRRENMTPSDRIVAINGQQVNIRAASAYSEATLETLGSEERLFVREGLVFGDCETQP
jgi:hypothetical protein